MSDLNIPLIDIHSSVFKKQKNPLSLFPFGLPGFHYNEQGYKLIAETILNYTK